MEVHGGPGEEEESESSIRECCERVAWSSVVGTIITLAGTLLAVTFIGLSSRLASALFSNSYIATSVSAWFAWMEIGAYIGLVVMICVVVLLLTMGCMATGYQNASSWCAFNRAKTGRRQLTAFMVLTYVINLAWYVIFVGSAIPMVFMFMLSNGVCTNPVFAATTCLDLRQFGLAPQTLSAAVNSTLICGSDLEDICQSSLLVNFFMVLLGCVFVLLGMNHYLMSLAGNYNWLRVRKRRAKLQAAKINRRSGTYDLNAGPYPLTERQESQDSTAHLRRVNLHYSSTDVLASSNASIPTVAGQVSLPTSSSSYSSAPLASSKTEPTSTASSMQSSTKIYNQTYGFDDGGFGGYSYNSQQQSTGSARVTFADTKATSAPAPSRKSGSTSSSPRGTTKKTQAREENDLGYSSRKDRSSRYDHYNPAFDENYWDHYYPPADQGSNDNYYSQTSQGDSATQQQDPSHTSGMANGSASVGFSGNYNQGYYNYEYDATDGGRYEMDPVSSFSQQNSAYTQQNSSYTQQNETYSPSHHDRKAVAGNKFFEYAL